MIGQPRSLQKAVELFRDPVTAEKRRLLADRWERSPRRSACPARGWARRPPAAARRSASSRAATSPAPAATSADEANRIPALPTAAVLAQLDELRRWLGPKSNVQITDGEVTLRPGRGADRDPPLRPLDRHRPHGDDPRRHLPPPARACSSG